MLQHNVNRPPASEHWGACMCLLTKPRGRNRAWGVEVTGSGLAGLSFHPDSSMYSNIMEAPHISVFPWMWQDLIGLHLGPQRLACWSPELSPRAGKDAVAACHRCGLCVTGKCPVPQNVCCEETSNIPSNCLFSKEMYHSIRRQGESTVSFHGWHCGIREVEFHSFASENEDHKERSSF